MKIASALLEPHLSEIESDFLRLITSLSKQDSPESGDLKTYIEKQLHQVHAAQTVLLAVGENPKDALSPQFFEDSKMMKLRLRFAERRWRLLLSNQARHLKMQERAENVASTAA